MHAGRQVRGYARVCMQARVYACECEHTCLFGPLYPDVCKKNEEQQSATLSYSIDASWNLDEALWVTRCWHAGSSFEAHCKCRSKEKDPKFDVRPTTIKVVISGWLAAGIDAFLLKVSVWVRCYGNILVTATY